MRNQKEIKEQASVTTVSDSEIEDSDVLSPYNIYIKISIFFSVTFSRKSEGSARRTLFFPKSPIPKPLRKFSSISMQSFTLLCVLLICLISQLGHGFYHPVSHPPTYVIGEPLTVKLNSLTSIDTLSPYSYYTLPFCKPQEGVKDSAENLGELLLGDWIQNSPYKFNMYTNETDIFLCQIKSLSTDEYKLLTKRIDEMYQVNLFLDDLPAIRYFTDYPRWTGYPIGLKLSDSYYVYNHLKFTVLVHKYEEMNVPGYTVVGFGVTPCSVDQQNHESLKDLKTYSKYPSKIDCVDNIAYMVLKENISVAFTYEVTFIESDIEWPSRWDAYLKMDGAKVDWFSIMNSAIIITFLAGIILVVVLRIVRREFSNWNLVVADVFCPSSNPVLLCVMVGNGVQILGTTVMTIIFGAMGFMSPASWDTLVTGMLIFYMIFGILAGYITARLWRTIFSGDHKGWVTVSLKVACFFPGITFLVLLGLNFLLWGSHSTKAIPFSLFVSLILLWFCISIPLTILGGYFGVKAPHIEYTNKLPPKIQSKKYPSWLLILGAGALPFSTLFMEITFIISSISMGHVYYILGFLFIVLILLVVVCAEVSLVLTYMHLCVEDRKWWWKSFFALGSVALYIFMYLIYYLIFDLMSLSGPISATMYLGYSLLMALAIMLVTGAIGFLSSFWFVHYLCTSKKLD